MNQILITNSNQKKYFISKKSTPNKNNFQKLYKIQFIASSFIASLFLFLFLFRIIQMKKNEEISKNLIRNL